MSDVLNFGKMPLTELGRALLELDRIDALRPSCPTCTGEGTKERLATPEEVDNGCELGIAFDPCPDCVDGRVSFEWMVSLWTLVHHPDWVSYEHDRGIRALVNRLQRVKP